MLKKMTGKNSFIGQKSSSVLLLSSPLTKRPTSLSLSPLSSSPHSSLSLLLPIKRLFSAAGPQETLLSEPLTSAITNFKGIETVFLVACNFLEDPPLSSLEQEEN